MYMPKSAKPLSKDNESTTGNQTGYMPKSARRIDVTTGEKTGDSSNPVLKFLSQAVGLPSGDEVNALLRAANIPSNVWSGIIEGGIQEASGTYEAPKIGQDISIGKGKVNLGDLIAPQIVGAARNVVSNRSLMESVPENLGIDPSSGEGVAVGLASELAAPDPLDFLVPLRIAGNADDVANPSVVGPLIDNVNTDAIKTAENLGIDLPLSAKTQNDFIKGVEAIAQKTLFGGKVRDRVISAYEGLDEAFKSLTTKLVKEQDFTKIGDQIVSGFDDFVKKYNKAKTKLYDEVPDEISSLPINPERTRSTIESIIGRKNTSLLSDGSGKIYQELMEKIKNTGQITYDQLKETRTFIGSKLNNKLDPVATGDEANLRRLYAALSTDMDEALKTGAPEAYEAIQRANAFYKQGLDLINSQMGKKIANSAPEDIFNYLAKPGRDSRIETLRQIVGDEGFKAYQEGLIQEMINRSLRRTQSDPMGSLNYKSLLQQIDRFGRKKLASFLSPDQMKRLDEVVEQLKGLDELEKALKSGTKPADGSQTAFNLLNSLAAGGAYLVDPKLAVGYILSSLGANTFVNSRLVDDVLTKGVDITPVSQGVQGVGNAAFAAGTFLGDELPNILNPSGNQGSGTPRTNKPQSPRQRDFETLKRIRERENQSRTGSKVLP